jgi:hypothetical protein
VNTYDVDAITFFTKARSAHEGHKSLLYKIILVIFVVLRAFVIRAQSSQSTPRILGIYSAASAASRLRSGWFSLSFGEARRSASGAKAAALNVICSQS